MILTGLTHDLQSSLFSAIVTAFLIRSLDDLEPNYQRQTVLLLHQLLNGRDPNLAIESDPTIPTKIAGTAIAVNCLWCASITLSLAVGFYGIILKWWITEYDSGPGPVGGLLRACRRHTRLKEFERLDFPVAIALLQTLLRLSIFLFFIGGITYGSGLNATVMAVFAAGGPVTYIGYFKLFPYASVGDIPFFVDSAFIVYPPQFAIGKVVRSIVGVIVHLFYFILRRVTAMVFFPYIQAVYRTGLLHDQYTKLRTTSPEEHEHTHVGQGIALRSPPGPDGIGADQEVQEEAILWLSQMPLDPPESEVLISSLALISPSRPYGRFKKPIVERANLVLEASFREEVIWAQTSTTVNCVLVLGNVKFRSAVDQNLDSDHDIGGIPVPPSVAWAAQQPTTNISKADLDIVHPGGVLGRLLAAAAWLSPMRGTENVEWKGEKLRIQDRSQFIKPIRTMLERHIHNEEPLDNKVLIDLIHGMHAFIPRGDRDNMTSVIPLPPYLREDYDSPWPEDEAVLRALVTYALDLLLPKREKKPLVEREIGFDDLARELIAALKVNTTHLGIVAFAFWLVSRVPQAFTSQKMVIEDIVQLWLWTNTNQATQGNSRERLNFCATDALSAIAQHHVVANGGMPKFTDYTALKLLNAALESGHCQPTTIYTMAMILNLGTSTQATPVANEIDVGSIINALFSSPGDIEKGVTEADVNIRIYSALVLLKLPPTARLDAEKVEGWIVQTEEVIWNPPTRDSGVARSSEADIGVDIDRARWKAIYLLALLFKFLSGDEREGRIERFRTRVRELLESGGLWFMDDYKRCLNPLGMDVSPTGDQRRRKDTVFEAWIGGFPLFQLDKRLLDQMHNRPSLLSLKRWFG